MQKVMQIVKIRFLESDIYQKDAVNEGLLVMHRDAVVFKFFYFAARSFLRLSL